MRHEEWAKDDELLTLAEAASRLHRSIATLRSWVSRRKVSAYKVNRIWFIASSEVQRILDENLIPRILPKREQDQANEGSEYEPVFQVNISDI